VAFSFEKATCHPTQPLKLGVRGGFTSSVRIPANVTVDSGPS